MTPPGIGSFSLIVRAPPSRRTPDDGEIATCCAQGRPPSGARPNPLPYCALSWEIVIFAQNPMLGDPRASGGELNDTKRFHHENRLWDPNDLSHFDSGGGTIAESK